MQYNDFLVYFSIFFLHFCKVEYIKKMFKNLERSSKLKDLLEDLCKIFERYCKDILNV